MSNPVAAWYPDPGDPARLRWWDGNAWTEHRHAATSPAAMAATDVVTPAPAVRWPPDASPPPLARPPRPAYVPVDPVAPAVEPIQPVVARPAPVMPHVIAPSNPHVLPTAAVLHPIQPRPAHSLAAQAERAQATPVDTLPLPPPPFQPPPAAAGPPPPMPNVKVTPERRGLRAIVVGAVAVAVAIAAFAVYSTGVLGSSGKDDREPSSTSMHVYSGKSYSFEIPTTWTEHDVTGTSLDYSFEATSPQTEFVVGISHETMKSRAVLDSVSSRSFLFAIAARAVQDQFEGLALISQTPVEVHGAQGQESIFSGTGVDGLPFRVVQTVFAHGRHLFMAAIASHGLLADDSATQLEYQTLVDSFRFG